MSAIPQTGQEPTTLYLLSNFAVGQTVWRPFWQERIAALEQLSWPFHYDRSVAFPLLLLQEKASALLAPLFEAVPEEIDQWSTWCTFICDAHQVSETFFLWSASMRNRVMETERSQICQKQEVVLRFEHRRDFPLLEAIVETGQLWIGGAHTHKQILVPLYDPELDLHLEYIRPLFH